MSVLKPVPSNSLRALPDGRLSFACPHCAATLALGKEKAVEGPCPHCGGLIALQPPKEKLIPPPPRSKMLPSPLSRPPLPSPYTGQASETRSVEPKVPVAASHGTPAEHPVPGKRRCKDRFVFLLIAPFIIAAIAYIAIVGAKPFREWVDARLAERAPATSEKPGPKTKPTPVAEPDAPSGGIPKAPAEPPPPDPAKPPEPKIDEDAI